MATRQRKAGKPKKQEEELLADEAQPEGTLAAKKSPSKASQGRKTPPVKEYAGEEANKEEVSNGLFGEVNFNVLVVSVLLRVFCFVSFGAWFGSRPEFSTPLTAIDRLREGILLRNDFGDAYAGDRVHVQPILVALLSGLLHNVHDSVVFAVFTMLDLLSGVLFSFGARKFSVERGEPPASARAIGASVLKWYLCNPLSIAVCCSLSVATIYSFFTSLFVFTFFSGCVIGSSVVLGVWTQLCMYPAILLIPLLFRSPNKRGIVLAIAVFSAVFALSIAANYFFAGHSFKFVDATYIFQLKVADLTPTVGIFWYFFIEIFEHFEVFFKILFQLNLIFYVIPAAVTLRLVPDISLFFSFVLMAVFVPYPSLADAKPIIALFPLIQAKYKQHQRLSLLTGCMAGICIVLMPVMWHMWIVSGTGNANFYFGVTLFYNVALIQKATDIMFAYLRKDVEERCPKDFLGEKKILVVYE